MSIKCFKTLMKGGIFKMKQSKPDLTVPALSPLSPCIIEPYVKNEGKLEENLAYVPVSLLVNAIEDKRMHNIAVAGNYGVGKSSVINTAEINLKHKHRFIKISLASLLTQETKAQKAIADDLSQIQENEFGDNLVEPDVVPSKSLEVGAGKSPSGLMGVASITDRQIEYSILQQILYHEKPQITPKSRMKRIHKVCWVMPILWTLLCVIGLGALSVLLEPKWFNLSRYYTFYGVDETHIMILKWWALGIIVLSLVIASIALAKRCSFSFSKVGYKSVEMKVKKDMSIFNAYLDEIVYFFESTKYDVVVFEDLDRFKNKEIIFYKLRELNTILNNSNSIGRNITFVYAVLDHLFGPIERVKFFDYIITILPVINSLNSYDKLKERINPPELFDKLGHTELHNLCDYLQDMRLLLNIVNEFNQLSPLMDDKAQNYKVLFGLVVYKNYAPDDFSKMYNKEGVVARIIEDAEKQRSGIIESFKSKEDKLREEIHSIEKKYNDNVVSLRKAYLEKGRALSPYSSRITMIQVAGVSYSIDKLAEQQGPFNEVRGGKARYVVNGIGAAIEVTPFDTIDANMGGIGSFDAASKGYKNEYDRQREDIKKKIEAIELEQKNFPSTVQGIYQYATDSLDRELVGLGDIDKIRMIKVLILNGYLDYHYQYYISYFYPNSLKRDDHIFVMKATCHEGPQFEVKLQSIEEVIMRFMPEDFSMNTALLNVDIVRVLYNSNQITDANKYKEAICKLITTQNQIDFLRIAYCSDNPISDAFFTEVLIQYDFWDLIDAQGDNKQDDLREMYVKYCDLRGGRYSQHFFDWLQDNYAFLDKRWDVFTNERMEELFKVCNPVFKTLSLKNTPSVILNNIMEGKRYAISRQNVNAIVTKLGFIKEYRSAALTTLRETKCTPLMRTLEANWPHTLSKVFPETSVNEDQAAMTLILNAAIRYSSKTEIKSYLTKQRNRIQFSDLLDDNILKFAFDQSLVQPTWRNVFYYTVTKENGLPFTFLYNNTFHDKVGDSLSTLEEEELCRILVFSNDVRLVDYKKLVHLFSTPITSIPFTVQATRMRFLVENNILAFNEENYKIVRQKYSLSTQFIVNNLDKYLSAPLKYEIDKSDALAVLKALPSKKAKCGFIRSIKDIDINVDEELASQIRPFVLSGELKTEDISSPLLLSVISGASGTQRIALGRRAILTIPYTRQGTTNILNAMGNEYKRFTTDSSSSTISQSRDAIIICNQLVRSGFIKSYEKKNNKLIITKVKH